MERQRQYGNESFAILLRYPYGISPKQFNTNYKGNHEQLQNSGKFMTLLEDYSQWFLVNVPIKSNSVLYEPLQKFILEFYQHGHMAFSESKWLPPWIGSDDEDEAQILTMKMLAAGFVVWLICVMISIIAFVLEIIFGNLKKTERTNNKK